ncbi:MAG: anaerobic ribonucleoside-triphosphate reductase activating protein [Lentisphaeria bacterium]|nr:anaerobic ribonucleoside-triphosphate reductase activating protein [Lentisphaeria bacterium]
MAINGLRKFSLIDYPGRLSCVVFLGHCNFRCPFCHNPVLIFDAESQGTISAEELSDFFGQRRGKLDAVVFSGGEPSLDPDLPQYVRLAKNAGFQVKLDTNGSFPQVLRSLYADGLLDALGIDYKAPAEKYPRLCGNPDPEIPVRVQESISFAVKNGIELDVRTTVHRALLSEDDLRTMYAELNSLGVSQWTIQQFHHAELIDESLNDTPTWSDAELKALAATLGPMTRVRGTL